MSKKSDILPLAEIATAINDELKTKILLPGDEDSLADIRKWCPTGVDLVDLFTYGGVPLGRVWEIYGEPHHGKSSLAVLLMTAVQRAGGITVLLDAEGSVTKERLSTFGHNPSRHLYMNADTVELGFRAIDKTLEKIRVTYKLDIPILFVWDTLAASQTESEKASDKYGDGMMAKPRLVREGLRRLSLELPLQQAGLVICNQTMATMDMYAPVDTPGGKATKFWSTYRIHAKRAGGFSPCGKDKGIISRLKMIKCKLGPPLREVEIPLSYDMGWENNYANFNYLTRNDATKDTQSVLYRKGNYYHLCGLDSFAGTSAPSDISFYASALYGKLDKHPEIAAYLTHLVRKDWVESYPGGKHNFESAS